MSGQPSQGTVFVISLFLLFVYCYHWCRIHLGFFQNADSDNVPGAISRLNGMHGALRNGYTITLDDTAVPVPYVLCVGNHLPRMHWYAKLLSTIVAWQCDASTKCCETVRVFTRQ